MCFFTFNSSFSSLNRNKVFRGSPCQVLLHQGARRVGLCLSRQLVRGATLPSPFDSWKRLSDPSDPSEPECRRQQVSLPAVQPILMLLFSSPQYIQQNKPFEA